jgi:toxin secretion/phage lysis holin
MDKIIQKINLLWGGCVTLLSGVLGDHWYLFCAFLVLNVVDYITGILKAKYFGVENSCEGLKGIIKKLGYWVCISIGFFLSVGLTEVGTIIGVDLGFTQLFGWFTLATFIINEIRSILENLVVMEVEIPSFLTKGLEVASEKLKGDDDNGSA